MLLKNAIAVTLSPPAVGTTDLRIEQGIVAEKGKTLRPHRGEEVHDLRGNILMPGHVCAHTHLYSSLSRGMPPPRTAPRGFQEILRNVWWKLDRALEEETIYASALAGAAEAVRLGTTTLIDHHASPNAIPGSLDIIRRAMNEVGIRGVLCYETTDRGGVQRRDAGLRENEHFAAQTRHDPRFRGMIGAHASFTLSDATMERLAELTHVLGSGLHIHAAEDASDARGLRGGIIRRLERFGLLAPNAILAHGVHLSGAECARVRSSGAWLVHNPRSNMNNAVGHAPVHLFGPQSALGTDGFPADMFEESKIGYLRSRESSHPVPFGRLPEMLSAGHSLARSIFGADFGSFRVGSQADFTILEYDPPTPLSAENVLGHFLFGMHARMATGVLVGGRWIMRDRELLTVDEELIARLARKAAERLWKKMGTIDR